MLDILRYFYKTFYCKKSHDLNKRIQFAKILFDITQIKRRAYLKIMLQLIIITNTFLCSSHYLLCITTKNIFQNLTFLLNVMSVKIHK